MLHPDRLVSFGFLNVSDFKGIHAGWNFCVAQWVDKYERTSRFANPKETQVSFLILFLIK